MCQEKPHLFFIHLLRFLALSDFSAYRWRHSVSTSYFGEGIVMYRSIIQEDIGSFLQLLAKLFKAFDHHIGINSPLNNIGK